MKLSLTLSGPDRVTGYYPNSAVEIATCVCIAQAMVTATHGGRYADKVTELAVVDWRGNPVPAQLWPSCNVSSSHWTWQHHGWTHKVKFPNLTINPLLATANTTQGEEQNG